MGAPRGKRTGQPRAPIAVRLLPATIAWLDSEAATRGMTRAGMAVRIIERVEAARTGVRIPNPGVTTTGRSVEVTPNFKGGSKP